MQEKKSNLWKEIKMQDLIYERKYGSKLIWKFKNGTWWWKPWMHERRRLEDRSSPQKAPRVQEKSCITIASSRDI